jgi:tetratricopeptide (TPR) repeat protein
VAAGLAVLFLTHCRAGWLAVVCATLWSVGLLLKCRAGWKRFAPAAVLVLCFGFCAGFFLSRQPVVKNSLDGSAQYRLIVWQNSLELLKQRPLAGHGAGSFAAMYGAAVNAWQTDTAFGKDTQIRRAHNDFVQTAVELGVPGAVVLAVLLGGALLLALRLMNAQRTALEQFILYAGSGALVAFLVTACFGFPFQRALTPLLAFACAGMISALHCREAHSFFVFSRRGLFAAAALVCAAAGIVALRLNLADIESDGYYKRAVAFEKRGNNTNARVFAQRAHDARPARMDVLTTLGRACITTGRLDEGIDALEAVTARQPYNLNALFILGAGYANAGRSAEALEAFRRVLDIKPDFIEAQRIVSRLKSQGRVKVNLR